MIAGIYNITIEQGSTFVRLISIEQPDLDTDPTGATFEPFVLTGYSARMQIRRTVESSTVMLSLTSPSGGIIISPGTPENELSITISAAVTAALTSSGVYDLEIVDAGGLVSKVVRGTVTLIPEVTR